MARPTKNSCEYFPHDIGMRNHPKVKAIRQKFDHGYQIWSMLLEYLTGADGNVFEYSDLQFELLSGDFGVSVTEIRDMIDYCIRIELLFNKNGFINSDSLDERLAPVYLKRGKAKEQSAKQCRLNGSFCSNNSDKTVVSVTETPQSKVNNSKVNNSNTPKTWRDDFEIYLSELRKSFYELSEDKEWILKQERYHPKIDILLSLEKACVNYWSTPAGWKKKKLSKSVSIDWKSTLTNALDLNKVYK